MRGIRKIVELMYIGMLWFICSIPLVTLGAATAALYEVLLKAVKNQEGYLFKSFLRAFQNNFKQGTCIWLPIALAEVLFSVNLLARGSAGRRGAADSCFFCFAGIGDGVVFLCVSDHCKI